MNYLLEFVRNVRIQNTLLGLIVFASLCHYYASLCHCFGPLCLCFGSLCHFFDPICHCVDPVCHCVALFCHCLDKVCYCVDPVCHYLFSPSGIFAIFTIDNNDNKSVNYLLKDHIGSITQIVDENANIIQKMNFDAWGRRRNPTTWTYDGIENESFVIDRGFTMHEHLTELKLINMNGRMYDPVMGRFLSTDPIVQLPDYNQSYNRYTYVLNNPLRFTDPSGFSFVENMDWFINTMTGDVYYNPEYGKDDVGKLEGYGWEHYAKNNKLSKSGKLDEQIIRENLALLNSEDISMEVDGNSDGSINSFSLEATFKGKKAEVFMNGQGKVKKRDIYKYHSDVTTDYLPEVRTQVLIPRNNSRIDGILSYQYVDKGLTQSKTIIAHSYNPAEYDIFKYAWFSPAYHIREQSWTYRQDIYGTKSPSISGNEINNGLNFINTNFPAWKGLYNDYMKKVINKK